MKTPSKHDTSCRTPNPHAQAPTKGAATLVAPVATPAASPAKSPIASHRTGGAPKAHS